MTNVQQQQQQAININPEDTKTIKCEKCGCEVFQRCFAMRSISSILSPTGKEETFEIPVPVCISCGTPYMNITGKEED